MRSPNVGVLVAFGVAAVSAFPKTDAAISLSPSPTPLAISTPPLVGTFSSWFTLATTGATLSFSFLFLFFPFGLSSTAVVPCSSAVTFVGSASTALPSSSNTSSAPVMPATAAATRASFSSSDTFSSTGASSTWTVPTSFVGVLSFVLLTTPSVGSIVLTSASLVLFANPAKALPPKPVANKPHFDKSPFFVSSNKLEILFLKKSVALNSGLSWLFL